MVKCPIYHTPGADDDLQSEFKSRRELIDHIYTIHDDHTVKELIAELIECLFHE